MPVQPAIALAALLLEDEDLVGARLLEDRRRHHRAFEKRRPQRRRLAIPNHKDFLEFDQGPRIAGQTLDGDHVVRRDPILLSTGPHDRVHGKPTLCLDLCLEGKGRRPREIYREAANCQSFEGVLACLRGRPGMARLRPRRGAGVVERGGLENRCAFAGTVGSNPTPSAKD